MLGFSALSGYVRVWIVAALASSITLRTTKTNRDCVTVIDTNLLTVDRASASKVPNGSIGRVKFAYD